MRNIFKYSVIFLWVVFCSLFYFQGSSQVSIRGATNIVLTSDQQLTDLMNPDKKIDLTMGYAKRYASLREICENAKNRGDTILAVVFDEFFRKYREQEITERLLTPDSDEYLDKIKAISDFTSGYDLGLELSLLSPLELGLAFKNQTGKSGRWMHYKVGNRDPLSGRFHIKLWQQLYWANNKGKFSIRLKDVKAYAFKETHLPNTAYKVVDRTDIIKLEEGIEFFPWGDSLRSKMNSDRARRVEVFCNGSNELEGYNRVMVLLEYEVPEMEYFSPEASPFLYNLLEKYKDKGINLKRFYSDEPHLQQDWHYFKHHDNGQFAIRYYSPALGAHYENRFGIPFEEKDLLYFVYGPDIDSNTAMAVQNTQYVMGPSNEDIHKTWLFRDNYYRMLNEYVVDLFIDAKKYATKLFGVEDWGTFGHASWAESPTVDLWDTRTLERHAYKYEYTPNFIWSNTVHQAAAACYDYFKWGEYLEPTRNDFAEGGWNDRNYYGAAMAASIGVLNRKPHAYSAFWGMPEEVTVRKAAINDAFGGNVLSHSMALITERLHRDVDVLVLYPMNLVAVEERFGSWVTQYGYCNYITAEKLLELGQVNEQGEIEIKDKKYTTLVALFEPLPNKGLLTLMDKFLQTGGKVLWFGPPPLINDKGEKVRGEWEQLFGVEYHQVQGAQGRIAPGMQITFTGSIDSIPEQTILTDFFVDRIYPVVKEAGTLDIAFCDNDLLVGTAKENAYFFGFRPRDDQSASLGYEMRTLFEILSHVGAYPPTGVFADNNDNTEYVSRTSDYLSTRFPNGTIVIVRHYRRHRENWHGGFSRDAEDDARVLAANPMPPDDIQLENFKVNGHTISYRGSLTTAFRMNKKNELIAFDGRDCKEVEIDGKKIVFSKDELKRIAFAPTPGAGDELNIFVEGEEEEMITIPLPYMANTSRAVMKGKNGKKIAFHTEEKMLSFQLNEDSNSCWLTLTW